MKLRLYLVVLCVGILFLFYNLTSYQHRRMMLEAKSHPFDTMTVSDRAAARIGYLPHGIVESYSDMELKSLWLTRSSGLEESNQNHQCLIAIPVGIKQKKNVDVIMKKFLSENFTAILFHYDGHVNGWNDLRWSKSVVHIAASNQTKWWFAKRFLHPDVVSMYEYIFLWDEDLGVDNFNPRRYLKIVKSEGLEISQPALDPKLSEIHHRITARRKKGNFHRRVYNKQGSGDCSSEEPPCAGWVEGMAPVFSKSAWQCAWHLIQNDLIHGWGIDFKFGYCAQGDRTKKIGVVDSEFIVHQGVQTLGGPNTVKDTSKKAVHLPRQKTMQVQRQIKVKGRTNTDARTEVRRRSRLELEHFQKRWEQATREDTTWVDPFTRTRRRQKSRIV